MTDEENRQRAELRKQRIQEYRHRFADLGNEIAEQRKATIALMRRRHDHYTKLISDAEIKTAQEFYDRFKEHFQMYGVKLELSEDMTNCSIYLELGDYDYEQYWIEDGTSDGFAVVSPAVAFKDMFTNLEINIFTGEYL